MEQIDTKHPPNLAIMPKIAVCFFGLIFFMFWYIIVCVGIKTAYIGTPSGVHWYTDGVHGNSDGVHWYA